MNDCTCGHQPKWHQWDRFSGWSCMQCAQCGETRYHHDTAFGGHSFKHSTCNRGEN